jgi:endonuclease/exonuclease/phosphatase (EEP) superfamily protein YafD
MDKDKLENLIIQELKKSWTDSAEKIAARIILKIPDEVVIAEGEVGYYKFKGIDRSEYTALKIGNATFNGVVREFIEEKYLGKNIRLKLEVLE